MVYCSIIGEVIKRWGRVPFIPGPPLPPILASVSIAASARILMVGVCCSWKPVHFSFVYSQISGKHSQNFTDRCILTNTWILQVFELSGLLTFLYGMDFQLCGNNPAMLWV